VSFGAAQLRPSAESVGKGYACRKGGKDFDLDTRKNAGTRGEGKGGGRYPLGAQPALSRKGQRETVKGAPGRKRHQKI